MSKDSVMMTMFCIYAVQCSSACHMWLFITWNMASVTEELNPIFHLILIKFDLNGHIYLVATG